jgi:hypothetical protein
VSHITATAGWHVNGITKICYEFKQYLSYSLQRILTHFHRTTQSTAVIHMQFLTHEKFSGIQQLFACMHISLKETLLIYALSLPIMILVVFMLASKQKLT